MGKHSGFAILGDLVYKRAERSAGNEFLELCEGDGMWVPVTEWDTNEKLGEATWYHSASCEHPVLREKLVDASLERLKHYAEGEQLGNLEAELADLKAFNAGDWNSVSSAF